MFVFAVRGDQFHATAGQVSIQAVRLVGVVPDETQTALRLAHAGASCFAGAKLPSMKVACRSNIAFVVEGLGEDLEKAPQHTPARTHC